MYWRCCEAAEDGAFAYDWVLAFEAAGSEFEAPNVLEDWVESGKLNLPKVEAEEVG